MDAPKGHQANSKIGSDSLFSGPQSLFVPTRTTTTTTTTTPTATATATATATTTTTTTIKIQQVCQ